jgi:hypothetical protein
VGSAASIVLARSDAESRFRDACLFVFLLAWLAYTRAYWTLAGGHGLLPTCPFYLITGHPCPLCGGTRSFASMWQADIVKAARFHPLGPVLFAGALVGVGLLAAGLASGRSWHVRLSRPARNGLIALVVVAFALSWSLKLIWLGN